MQRGSVQGAEDQGERNYSPRIYQIRIGRSEWEALMQPSEFDGLKLYIGGVLAPSSISGMARKIIETHTSRRWMVELWNTVQNENNQELALTVSAVMLLNSRSISASFRGSGRCICLSSCHCLSEKRPHLKDLYLHESAARQPGPGYLYTRSTMCFLSCFGVSTNTCVFSGARKYERSRVQMIRVFLYTRRGMEW